VSASPVQTQQWLHGVSTNIVYASIYGSVCISSADITVASMNTATVAQTLDMNSTE